MTEGERAIVKEIAHEACDHIYAKLKDDVKDAVNQVLEVSKREAEAAKSSAVHQLELHIVSCPLSKRVEVTESKIAAVENQAHGVKWAAAGIVAIVGLVLSYLGLKS